MGDNLLCKLIDDGGDQFPDAHLLLYNDCKAVKIGLILFKDFYRFPPYLDLLCQFSLFHFIVSGEFQEPFVADCIADIVLKCAYKFGPVRQYAFPLGRFRTCASGPLSPLLEIAAF